MKVIFVRHGEPNYTSVKNLELVAYLGELTSKGVDQATNVAKDSRLEDAELIISSPFTRALQTAAIISRITQIPLTVEPRIHEWLDDTSHLNTLDEIYQKEAYHEFVEKVGKRDSCTKYNWEDISQVAKRAYQAIDMYRRMGFKKIIVVAHAVLIRTFGYSEQRIPPCTIFEKEFDENTKFESFTPWKG